MEHLDVHTRRILRSQYNKGNHMFNDSMFAGKDGKRGKAPHSVLKLVMAGCGALVLANCMGSQTEVSPVSNEGNQAEQAVVKDTFLLEKDIVLAKGKFVPKGTFILKPDETKEYYIKTSSGPWEFGGLAKIASTGSDKMVVPHDNHPGTWGVEEIALVAGSSAAGCPSTNHVKIKVDLNRGAGGPYVFICPSGPVAGTAPIKYIDIQSSSSGSDFTANKPTTRSNGILGWLNSNSDMNQGTGGNYIWGRYTLWNSGDPSYIDGVGVSFKDHWWESIYVPSGWLLASDKDLNYGAGGAYIFMVVRRYNI